MRPSPRFIFLFLASLLSIIQLNPWTIFLVAQIIAITKSWAVIHFACASYAFVQIIIINLAKSRSSLQEDENSAEAPPPETRKIISRRCHIPFIGAMQRYVV
jgi:hypothetical protein